MSYKEKFTALIVAVEKAGGEFMADDLDFVGKEMDKFVEYVRSVYSMETMIPIIMAKYEGQDVRDRIELLDKNRRTKHEAAIDAISKLDRLADERGVAHLYEGDAADRHAVADFCIQIVTEFFITGQRPIEEELDDAEFKDLIPKES